MPADRRPRRSAARAGPQRISFCRLKVELPEPAWIARFSRRHPDLTLEVVDRLDLDARRSLSEVRLRSESPGAWAEELRRFPDVREVVELGTTPGVQHLRITYRTVKLVSIFRRLRLPPRFPFTIRAGTVLWVLIAPRPRVLELIARLRRAGAGVDLEMLRSAPIRRPDGPLTVHQADLLRQARQAGYFEVPRAVSLSELARQLHMAVSSLSERLAVIERALIEEWPGVG